MIKSKRKILIAILGCPAVGKSFLIRKIKEEINPDVIQEFSRNSLPRKIKCNLEDRKNLFETLLWFRNLQISNHLEACKKEKDITIIDTPFYQYKFYIDFYLANRFHKEILNNLFELDWQCFRQPDLTIYIKTTPKLIKKFLTYRKGERSWESQEDWPDFISKVHHNFDYMLSNEIVKPNNLLVVNREEYDFDKKDDLRKLLAKINERL